jgi:hypothetical protein
MRFALLFVLLLAAGHGFATPAVPPDTDLTNRARAAFLRGTELAKAGHWSDALEAFEQSSELKPHPVTTYNIAYCERELGRQLRAWTSFSRALEAHAAPDGDQLPADLLYSAEVYRSELESKLARISIRIPGGATLAVDGEPLTKSGDNDSFDLLLEPGMHTFRVSTTAERATELRRELVSGHNQMLVLELAPETPAPVAVPVSRARQAHSATPRAPARDYTWPIVAYGVGAVGLGVGAVFGLRALDQERELEKICPDRRCPARYEDQLDAANRDALLSTAGFGVAVAGAALGTYLLLTLEPERPAVAPELGLGWAGVRGAF